MASDRHVTSYEYSSTYDSDFGRTIRPGITPRNLIFQRTAAGQGGTSRSAQFSSSLVQGGGFGGVAVTGVSAIKSERDKEKREMQDLNERFASYIEKVRFLEAQNRRLGDELEKLKAKWGKESSKIKSMYQTELDEAKRLLEEAKKKKVPTATLR